MTTAIKTSDDERKTTDSAVIKYEKYARDIPDKFRGNYLKAMKGNSRVCAVKAKCLDCTCWQPKEITLCPATNCPLYPYRPYKPKR